MLKKKRGTILTQVMRPMVLFIIVLILSNGLFIFFYNLEKNIRESYSSALNLGLVMENDIEEYQALPFLKEYWMNNSENMHKFYDRADEIISREKYFYVRFPNISSITQITMSQVNDMTDMEKKLFAEVCYSRISELFDSFKRSYRPKYLYSVVVEDGMITFLNTGTLEAELRISQGGEIFELGQQFPYNRGDYPVLDKLLDTGEVPKEMELTESIFETNTSVHTFTPVYFDGNMVMIISVSIEWTDLIRSALRPALVVTSVTAALFAILGISIYLLIKKSVIVPAKSEQDAIKGYEENKDSEVTVGLLEKINSDNEIQTLGEQFSSMVKEMDRYIEEIRTVTSEKERIGAELSMAASIQESQLPNIFPAFPDRTDFDIFASMDPAKEVGGDFYDFFLIDDDHLGLVMADVSGKGIPAALFMMISKILLKNHLQNGESVSEAIANVNNQLMENNEESLFVTVWAAVIELSTGKGQAANAGHEHPVLRRADGQFEFVEYKHSPPVATYPGLMFKQHEFELKPGDTLFVYTDGLPEATNADKELFGGERILNALNRKPDADPEILLNIVTSCVDEFVGEAEQFDDLTMLSLKYYGPDREDSTPENKKKILELFK